MVCEIVLRKNISVCELENAGSSLDQFRFDWICLPILAEHVPSIVVL